MLKRLVKTGIKNAVRSVARLLPRLPGGQYAFQQLLESGMAEHGVVLHKGQRMQFATPNALCRYRVSSFATKEPETLDWIDALPDGIVLWDIGANVGLYSVYAARQRNARVFSFEPSVFNLELLARNIYLNGLQDQVVIVPVPLSDAAGPSLFRMSTTQWGGALSTFSREYGQDGQTLDSLFEYRICGMTMDEAVARLELPLPHAIKMDVDGIEHLILSGGAGVLGQVSSVLVEINDDFAEQAESAQKLLRAAGLSLYRKCPLGETSNQYNQWWTRTGAN